MRSGILWSIVAGKVRSVLVRSVKLGLGTAGKVRVVRYVALWRVEVCLVEAGKVGLGSHGDVRHDMAGKVGCGRSSQV